MLILWLAAICSSLLWPSTAAKDYITLSTSEQSLEDDYHKDTGMYGTAGSPDNLPSKICLSIKVIYDEDFKLAVSQDPVENIIDIIRETNLLFQAAKLDSQVALDLRKEPTFRNVSFEATLASLNGRVINGIISEDSEEHRVHHYAFFTTAKSEQSNNGIGFLGTAGRITNPHLKSSITEFKGDATETAKTFARQIGLALGIVSSLQSSCESVESSTCANRELLSYFQKIVVQQGKFPLACRSFSARDCSCCPSTGSKEGCHDELESMTDSQGNVFPNEQCTQLIRSDGIESNMKFAYLFCQQTSGLCGECKDVVDDCGSRDCSNAEDNKVCQMTCSSCAASAVER